MSGYDARLRRLGLSRAGMVTTADRADPISLYQLRLPRLTGLRRVRFTNRFTGANPLDRRLPAFPVSLCQLSRDWDHLAATMTGIQRQPTWNSDPWRKPRRRRITCDPV